MYHLYDLQILLLFGFNIHLNQDGRFVDAFRAAVYIYKLWCGSCHNIKVELLSRVVFLVLNGVETVPDKVCLALLYINYYLKLVYNFRK